MNKAFLVLKLLDNMLLHFLSDTGRSNFPIFINLLSLVYLALKYDFFLGMDHVLVKKLFTRSH